MPIKEIVPWEGKFFVEGKVSYSEGYRAWNTIRLKKEFINQFPKLKQTNNSIKYKVICFKDHNEFYKTTKEIISNRNPLPILLYLYEDSTI